MNSESDLELAPATASRGTSPQEELSGSVQRDPSGSIWIIDWWRDLLFFIATPLVLIPCALIWGSQLTATPIYLLALTFGAVGHQLPGFLRVYGDRELFAEYRWRLIAAPVLMLAIGLGFSLSGHSGLSLLLLAWGFWHVLTQQYGFMRIYDAKVKSFAPRTIRLDLLMCFFWFGAGIVFSPQRMELLLSELYGVGGPLIAPAWIQGTRLLWAFLTAAVTVLFIMNYVAQRRQGQAASLLKLLVMAAGFGLWWFAGVNIRDLLLGILLFELFHAVQYVALARYYGTRRTAQSNGMGPVSRQLFRPGLVSLGLLLLATLAFGLPAYWAGITPRWLEYNAAAGMVPQMIFGLVAASTLLHYYSDGFVWQLRGVRLRDALEVPDAPEDVRAAWPVAGRIPHLAKWAFLFLPIVLLIVALEQRGPQRESSELHANLVNALPFSWKAHGQRGADLLQENDPKQAAEHLLEAVKLYPEGIAVRCDLGRALRELGEFDQAIEQFETAIEFAGDSAIAYAELGKTQFGLGEKEKGVSSLRRAAQLAPRDTTILYELALAETRLGEFDAALETIGRAIGLDPTQAELFNARGNIYWNQKELEPALDDFGKAIELDPQMAKAYRNRAGVWLFSGDPQSAVEDLTKAIGVENENWRNYLLRGQIYNTQGKYEEARQDIATAVLNAPNNPQPLQTLITFLSTCPDEEYRQPDQAISLAHTLCKQSGYAEPSSLQLLAETLARAEKFKEAIRWQQQAIEMAASEGMKETMRPRLEDYRQAEAGDGEAFDGETDEKAEPNTAGDTRRKRRAGLRGSPVEEDSPSPLERKR